jgi:hypothetical protein
MQKSLILCRHRLRNLEAMLETNTPPQIVYAYCRTGFVVSDTNRATLAQELLSQWDTAILEYFAFEDRAGNAQH